MKSRSAVVEFERYVHSLAVCAGDIATGEFGQLQPGAYQPQAIIGGIVLKFERDMLCH